jgi:2-C-methyl-D-erythritol 4-phosphate cytidylyltransferase
MADWGKMRCHPNRSPAIKPFQRKFPFQHNMISSRHFALIPAAGIGARMRTQQPKQYMRIAGKPMLLHVLDTFAASPTIAHAFVVVGAEDGYINEVLSAAPHLAGRLTVLWNGGATRHASVLNGLHAMREQVGDDEWVLVHDAARPGLTVALIDKLVQSLNDDAVGGLLALPVVDTIKRSDMHRRVQATVPREELWAAQTPQMFRYGLLRRALEQAANVTDEASAVEALGLQPKLVEGSPRNFKVTMPHDAALAELYLKESHE